ncbi:hypothetical protein EGW08_014433, partial [Elysia chlorotica]
MTTNTIKSSFFVRKSGRLSMKKNSEEKKSDSPTQKCSEFDGIDEPTKKSGVTSALRQVFHKRDRKKEEKLQGTDFEHMLQVKNADRSPISPTSARSKATKKMASCCGTQSSNESVFLPPTPGSTVSSGTITPVLTKPGVTAEELTQACRRLLSPSKRKSDDENEFGCCNISPVKSPRSSPDDVSPVKPLNRSRTASSPSLCLADQTTPKSCSRLISRNGSGRIPTSTPRRLFGSPEKKSSISEELTPKKLTGSGLLAPNNTPNSSFKQNSKLYQSAKRSLHTAKPDRLIGRDAEIVEL